MVITDPFFYRNVKKLPKKRNFPIGILAHFPTFASRKNREEKFTVMARVCQVTGKSSQMGGRYSNRTRATQFNPCGNGRRYANLQKKKVFVPELNKSLNLTLSTRAIKTIQKKGAYATLKEAGVI